jgi:hypothetical protein
MAVTRIRSCMTGLELRVRKMARMQRNSKVDISVWSRPSYSFFHHLGCATPRLLCLRLCYADMSTDSFCKSPDSSHVTPRLVCPMQSIHPTQPMQSD